MLTADSEIYVIWIFVAFSVRNGQSGFRNRCLAWHNQKGQSMSGKTNRPILFSSGFESPSDIWWALTDFYTLQPACYHYRSLNHA